MTGTYIYGYAGERYTRAQIDAMSNFNKLHPEIRRRLWALVDECPTDLGFGSAWRSRARAQLLYELYISGQRSMPAAPPDRSYHCEKQDGYCYAMDMVGDLAWMNANCHRFGLRHFANVNGEPHHVQPIELPTGCSPSFRGAALAGVPLPGNPPPIQPIQPSTSGDELMPTANDVWQEQSPNYIRTQQEGHEVRSPLWQLVSAAHMHAYKADERTAQIAEVVAKLAAEVAQLQDALVDGEGFIGNGDGRNFWNGIREIVRGEIAALQTALPSG